MKKIIPFLILVLFLLGPFFVFSETLYPPVPGAQSPSEFIETAEAGDILPLFIKYLYGLSIMLSVFITGGIVIYASFLYFISFGKVSRIVRAREWFVSAAQGALIVFGSYLILFLINPDLTFLRPIEVTPPGMEFPDVDMKEEVVPVYFQVPVGKIIENSVLNEDAEEKLYSVVFAVNEIKETSDEIYEKSDFLNDLIQSTYCGSSLCNSDCSPTGCSGYDGRPEIDEFIEEEIDVSLELMQEKIVSLSESQALILHDIYQIEAVASLMSLEYDKILDYNTLLLIQEYEDIEIDTFPGWEDITLQYEEATRNDPFTFYLRKIYSTDEINIARNIYAGGINTTPLAPPGGWAPPPDIGAVLYHPTGTGITSNFGMRFHPIDNVWKMHNGIDFGHGGYPTRPIYASADGVVTYAGWMGGYGKLIIIQHPSLKNIHTRYAHLSFIGVSVGDIVSRGEEVGRMGSTGNSTGPHLHFEVRNLDGGVLDPNNYLE